VKDFDAERLALREGEDPEARTFVLGGEKLTFRPFFHPDVLIHAQTAFDDSTLLNMLDDAFLNDLLEPGQEKKWEKVRARDNPLAPHLKDLVAVVNYITETVTGRPTEPPSDSSEPSSNGGTTSTGRSRSKASTSAP
jgi:hypothetical protein